MRRTPGEARVIARRIREDRAMMGDDNLRERNWRKSRPIGCPEGRREHGCSGMKLGRELHERTPTRRELLDEGGFAYDDLRADEAIEAAAWAAYIDTLD